MKASLKRRFIATRYFTVVDRGRIHYMNDQDRRVGGYVGPLSIVYRRLGINIWTPKMYRHNRALMAQRGVG